LSRSGAGDRPETEQAPSPLIPGIGLESEQVFRLLVESVTDYAIFVLDPGGHIATWNPGAQRFKGYIPEEIIGRHFSIFYPESDIRSRKPWRELEVATEVGRFEDEGWRIRKDGTRFWANVVITRLLGRDGKLLGFGKITRDLTERRLADQRYRMLVEGVQDYAIYGLDVNGNVNGWNVGAERIKGYSSDEIVGQHFSRFYTPEDMAAGMPQKVLETARKERHFEGEGWRVRKDGTRFWSSVVVTAIFDEEGNLTGYSKVTRDITDRKKLMDQISAHARELELRIAEREATNAELEAFSYSVSHDLRAPLRAIDGFSEALMEDHAGQLDDEGLDFLREIRNAARRMTTLVQDLLNYSRLGRVELRLTDVNVGKLAESVASEAGEDQKCIRIEVPSGTAVLAHEPTVRQVLSNLISNGLKFRRKEVAPEVVIQAERNGDRIRIAVTDNGIGIERGHQDRVFKVFERLHSSEEFPGTGIGLAIVQRAVTRMGGSFGLQSEPGKGSTFWVELPSKGVAQQ
jgi:PAS domain S-box-containing protein